MFTHTLRINRVQYHIQKLQQLSPRLLVPLTKNGSI